MKTPIYQQTPPGIMFILDLFAKNKLSYILFKCEHIFAGQNKNVDILFETNEDYARAGVLLSQQGFVVRLSEKVEKYKTMYCGFVKGVMYSIHLHREIAWHGMVALDKREVFARKKMVTPLIVIPGLEDSILIHAAHVLFENFRITEKEKVYLAKIGYANKSYLRYQIRKHHWSKGFQKVLQNKVNRATISSTWSKKVLKEPATLLYLATKLIKKIGRTLSCKRQGILIALIGVNGTGKTTLSKGALEQYYPITKHLGSLQRYYYFGWSPEFFMTRLFSNIMRRSKKKIFSAVAIKSAPKNFSFAQEGLFLYIFAEFLYRYLKNIWPYLRKKGIIVSDRYFYDIYGQYPYAAKSILLKFLLRSFPKPDYTFLLDAPLEKIQNRGKESRAGDQILERRVLPEEYLHQQRQQYESLKDMIPILVIDTSQDTKQCTNTIIENTWRKVV